MDMLEVQKDNLDEDMKLWMKPLHDCVLQLELILRNLVFLQRHRNRNWAL